MEHVRDTQQPTEIDNQLFDYTECLSKKARMTINGNTCENLLNMFMLMYDDAFMYGWNAYLYTDGDAYTYTNDERAYIIELKNLIVKILPLIFQNNIEYAAHKNIYAYSIDALQKINDAIVKYNLETKKDDYLDVLEKMMIVSAYYKYVALKQVPQEDDVYFSFTEIRNILTGIRRCDIKRLSPVMENAA
jgi:hypothetical protein